MTKGGKRFLTPEASVQKQFRVMPLELESAVCEELKFENEKGLSVWTWGVASLPDLCRSVMAQGNSILATY